MCLISVLASTSFALLKMEKRRVGGGVRVSLSALLMCEGNLSGCGQYLDATRVDVCELK